LQQRQGLYDAYLAKLLRPDFRRLLAAVLGRLIDDLEKVAFDRFGPLQNALAEVEDAKRLHAGSTSENGRCAATVLD
jgi:hypothetical protein